MSTRELRPDPEHRAAWEAIRSSDRAAFLQLYETYHAALCRFAVRFVKTRATAEDLVHDVFLRIWSQRVEWNWSRSVRGYLYTAVRNQAIEFLRRGQAEQRVLAARGADPDNDGAARPEGEMQIRELAAALQRAIDELPPRPREILLLKWQRQLTNPEIAAELGLSLKTVEMHVTRAFDGLRASLPAEWRSVP